MSEVRATMARSRVRLSGALGVVSLGGGAAVTEQEANMADFDENTAWNLLTIGGQELPVKEVSWKEIPPPKSQRPAPREFSFSFTFTIRLWISVEL